MSFHSLKTTANKFVHLSRRDYFRDGKSGWDVIEYMEIPSYVVDKMDPTIWHCLETHDGKWWLDGTLQSPDTKVKSNE